MGGGEGGGEAKPKERIEMYAESDKNNRIKVK